MDAGIIKQFVDEVFRKTPIVTDNSIVVSSGIATLTTIAAHGLAPGDKVIIDGVANEELEGFRKILSTPTTTSFTFDAAGIADGPDGNNPNIDYFKIDLETILADSYSSAPEKPYATVKIFSDKEQGLPIPEVESVSPTEVNQLMSTWNVATCELQFYSNDSFGELSAQNLAKYFITALGFERSVNFQRNNGFGVLNRMMRRNADIIIPGGGDQGDIIERRQIFEFTINYVYTISDPDVYFFNEEGVKITVNQEL